MSLSGGSITAVISTYRPDHRVVAAVQSLRSQVDAVIVVDDATPPSPAVDEVLTAATAAGAQIIRLSANGGIGAALNRGVAMAFSGGVDAILTFDQDSVVDDRYADRLAEALDALRAKNASVAAVVPERFAQVSQITVTLPDGTPVARNPIQSGMLIPRDTWERFGGFREDFFIDLVDTEYERRLRSAGLSIAVAVATELPHSLGARYRAQVFGIPLRFPGAPRFWTLSTPFRYYYRVRNRIVLDREYPALRSRRDTVVDTLHFAITWTLAQPRASFGKLLRQARAAGRDAVMGQIPDDLARAAAAISWRAPRIED